MKSIKNAYPVNQYKHYGKFKMQEKDKGTKHLFKEILAEIFLEETKWISKFEKLMDPNRWNLKVYTETHTIK